MLADRYTRIDAQGFDRERAIFPDEALAFITICTRRLSNILTGPRPRGTGTSPTPLFETDDDWIAFVIRLPGHPLARGGATATAQVTEQATDEVQRLLCTLTGEMSRQQLRDALGLAHREHFRSAYLKPALDAGLVEMTLPDKPSRSAATRASAHHSDKHCPVYAAIHHQIQGLG